MKCTRPSIAFGIPSILYAVLLAGCGGGGGGGAASVPSGPSGPTAAPPTATPRAYALPSAGPVSQSTISIDSQPHGLAVTIDGQSGGVTPASSTPAFAATAHVVTVVPSPSASPYVVSFAQTADGPHSIFYNQSVDTPGKIASISTASVARAPLGASARVSVMREMSSISSRPLYSDRRFFVRYDLTRMPRSANVASIERAAGAVSALTAESSGTSALRVVTLAPSIDLATAMRQIAAQPGVSGVDRVRLRYPLASSSGPVYPNDTYFGDQWYLGVIDAVDAWGYGAGNASTPIAVIDTGYDPNQAQIASLVTYSEKIVGGDIYVTSGAATDTDGHGTFLSGIASSPTAAGVSFAGVGYGAALQEYKIFPDGVNPVADSADEAEAIREAVANHAKVILLAVGGPASAGPDPYERDAVAFALASGVSVVAATGDDGASAIDFPAAYDGVIAVGASSVVDTGTPGVVTGGGNYEHRAAYSNDGPGLSLLAPGGEPSSSTDGDLVHWIENLYTTQPFAGDPSCGSVAPAACIVRLSGTSPAAAQVAGAAALMLSLDPAISPPQVGQLLDASADDIGDPTEGAGRLNVHRAMAAVAGDASPAPALPAPSYGQFVAFAYTGSGTTTPAILDVTYPKGVPVNPDGTFRIADIPVAAQGTYKIGVWVDVNGDGIVDAGDYFGATGTCTKNGPCANATRLAVARVHAGFVLP